MNEQYSKIRYRVYGFSSCPFCKKAQELLRSEGVPFTYQSIDDPDERKAFVQRDDIPLNHNTFPCVYKMEDGRFVFLGGYSELETDILLSS